MDEYVPRSFVLGSTFLGVIQLLPLYLAYHSAGVSAA